MAEVATGGEGTIALFAYVAAGTIPIFADVAAEKSAKLGRRQRYADFCLVHTMVVGDLSSDVRTSQPRTQSPQFDKLGQSRNARRRDANA